MRRLLMTLCVLLWASPVLAQVPVVGTETLVWDQVGASLATVQTYTFDVKDGALPWTALPGVTCSGAASPFVCSTRLPALTTGLHSVMVAAKVTVNGQVLASAPSAPLSLLIMAVPAAPQNVRIGP